MARQVIGPGIEIRFDQETEVVNSLYGVKKPDQKWREIDANGHAHAWFDDELPTLEWIVTGTQWVGDEYDGVETEIGEYRCRQCAEVIVPGHTISYQPQIVAGPPRYTLVLRASIMDQEYPIQNMEDALVLIELLRRVFA